MLDVKKANLFYNSHRASTSWLIWFRRLNYTKLGRYLFLLFESPCATRDWNYEINSTTKWCFVNQNTIFNMFEYLLESTGIRCFLYFLLYKMLFSLLPLESVPKFLLFDKIFKVRNIFNITSFHLKSSINLPICFTQLPWKLKNA